MLDEAEDAQEARAAGVAALTGHTEDSLKALGRVAVDVYERAGVASVRWAARATKAATDVVVVFERIEKLLTRIEGQRSVDLRAHVSGNLPPDVLRTLSRQVAGDMPFLRRGCRRGEACDRLVGSRAAGTRSGSDGGVESAGRDDAAVFWVGACRGAALAVSHDCGATARNCGAGGWSWVRRVRRRLRRAWGCFRCGFGGSVVIGWRARPGEGAPDRRLGLGSRRGVSVRWRRAGLGIRRPDVGAGGRGGP